VRPTHVAPVQRTGKSLKVTPAAISDVLVVEPTAFFESHGFFYEGFNENALNEASGLKQALVPDNRISSPRAY
jgi:dTDP-4-dehydrorhamnose 3,5-epimerase